MQHDEINVRAIEHAHMFRKDKNVSGIWHAHMCKKEDIFRQRRLNHCGENALKRVHPAQASSTLVVCEEAYHHGLL